MKMNKDRIEEIKKFRDKFNEDLKNAFKIYEEKFEKQKGKQKENEKNKTKAKSLRKCLTANCPGDIEYRREKIIKDKGSMTLTDNIFKQSPAWQPNNYHCNYFEEFKRLRDGHYMSIWEKVNNNIYNNKYIFYNYFHIFDNNYYYFCFRIE